MAQIDIKKTTVTFHDGAGHTLALKVSEGVLTYTEKKPRKYTKDRGLLSAVMDADQEPIDVKIDLIWEFITSSSGTPTPSDFLKKVGPAASYTSSDSDTCNPYSVDIVIVYDPMCSPTEIETITLPTFRYEDIAMELKTGQLVIAGKCNVTEATAVRS